MPLRALPASAGASENIAAILATIVPYDQPIRLPVTHQSASEHTA
jgi:hypothetical protein